MSWSLDKKGTVEKVREAVIAEFDRCAAQYAGKEEEKDVLAVKERTLVALAEFAEALPSQYANAVSVVASGSHGVGWMSLKVDITSLRLEI